MRRWVLLSLALVLCGAAVVLVFRSPDSQVAGEAGEDEEGTQFSFSRDEISSSKISGKKSSRILTERQEAHLQLKKKLSRFLNEVGNSDMTSEQDVFIRSLAKEAVTDLSCSRELIDLIASIKGNNRGVFFDLIEAELKDRFVDPKTAQKMRADLLELPGDMESYKIMWTAYAVEGCSEMEFYFFADLLEKSGRQLNLDNTGVILRRAAVLSYAKKLERDNSYKSISVIIDKLDEENQFAYRMDRNPFPEFNNFPDDMDFRKFQEQVMDRGYRRIAKGYLQDRFASAWVAIYPDEATAYFFERRDAYKPRIFGNLTSKILEQDKTRGIEWVLQLPEGIHRDHGLRAIVLFFRDSPSEALEFTEKIQDSTIRDRASKGIGEDPELYAESF